MLEEIADLKLQLAKQRAEQAQSPANEKVAAASKQEPTSQSFGLFRDGSYSSSQHGRLRKKN